MERALMVRALRARARRAREREMLPPATRTKNAPPGSARPGWDRRAGAADRTDWIPRTRKRTPEAPRRAALQTERAWTRRVKARPPALPASGAWAESTGARPERAAKR